MSRERNRFVFHGQHLDRPRSGHDKSFDHNVLGRLLFDHSVQALLEGNAVSLLLGQNGQKFTIDDSRERMHPGGANKPFHNIRPSRLRYPPGSAR
jgi:hypothetical protein